MAPPPWIPLSFYFLRVLSFPQDDEPCEFPTALRMLYGEQDFPTRIDPITIAELPLGFRPYLISTYTEYYTPVFAGGRWPDHYFKAYRFNGYLWRDQGLLILNAVREVVEGFFRSCRDEADDRLDLRRIRVDLERLGRETERATKITLEMESDSKLPGSIRKAILEGREVERSQEVQHYRAAGAVGRGLQFGFAMSDYPELAVAVTDDGSIRLIRHIGPRGEPHLPAELRLVAECWRARVARFHEMRPLRREESAKSAKKARRPGPVQGQKTLDDALEGGA